MRYFYNVPPSRAISGLQRDLPSFLGGLALASLFLAPHSLNTVRGRVATT
mgnify:CR=1 FL=1